jgi:transposase
MEVLLTHCAALDVHKASVQACRITPDADGKPGIEERKFTTFTKDIIALRDWLQEASITHVALESTGSFWRPIYNLLEGHFELLLVNPHHVKNVPGRKTDVKDARWLVQLLQHGLVRPSFVPPEKQRALRDLTRTRTSFVEEKTRLVNRIQKTLEDANIKLSCVASDVVGVSGRAMLSALIGGEQDPVGLAQLARGRMRSKTAELEAALLGHVKPHHALILTQLLCQIDSVEASIERLEAAIEETSAPYREAVVLLDGIPGIGVVGARAILSEIGTDMSRFPTASHLCAWAGVAPGNNESAGKQRSSKTRQGNRALRRALVEAARAAVKAKDSYLQAQYHRLKPRCGSNRAIVAVAHSILQSIYYLLVRNEPYKELGADYFDQRRPVNTTKRLVGRLEKLGYKVTLETQTLVAA